MTQEETKQAQGAPCQGCGAQTPYNESHGDHRWPFCGSKVYPGDEYFCAACAHKTNTEATTFEQLKSEQPDHKQAFTWRSKAPAFDHKTNGHPPDYAPQIAAYKIQVGAKERREQEDDLYREKMEQEEDRYQEKVERERAADWAQDHEEEVYNTTSDAEHDPRYDY